MPTIVVDVMPKAELLDPQGKAVAGALARTGHTGFSGVRIGKRFELTVDGPVDDALRANVQQIAEEILSNQVIEDVVGIHYEVTNAELAEEAAEAGAVAGDGFGAPAGETH
ncbi:phosphoribosylformylglycinamidine synthase subunit PurS [Agromyces sp. H3Y2-19a]|uniref:phosphoribosylformylglycinamidine synthase subunit PurS n=1 Tax=Agromyces TaxID=33877 RepID=UPI001E294A71|nr:MULTISPECIES: phosphoribosylformylglycinamidine synthase subunit PurS [Agromyces]MCD5345806.1 phosphoribosylformylglycinamidine synthase subunit PurS [Agromyces sp. S2-1-8]MDF0512172.1 phosphoribosylformylglycinamidine synthase subunit PurS [Agromyces chromiiresistens]